MNWLQTLKRGISLSFTDTLSEESFAEIRENGIDCVEMSFKLDRYIEEFDFLNRAGEYAEIIKNAGLEWWSIHLPFSRNLDISFLDDEMREETVRINTEMILAAGRAGCKVAVMHPSIEPISDEDRPKKLAYSRENIIRLAKVAESVGMRLAVENLPRTCLCNRSQEMIDLVSGTGAGVVFDTNRSLIEDNVEFLQALVDGGLEIITLHVSDYDFIDECHRLPGDGKNDWRALFSVLERTNYRGPLLYEIAKQPKDRDELTVRDIGDNMKWLVEHI